MGQHGKMQGSAGYSGQRACIDKQSEIWYDYRRKKTGSGGMKKGAQYGRSSS